MSTTNNMNQLPKAARKVAGDALCNAVAKGDTQLVKELIDNGADVNWKNGKGLTPLHMAAYIQRPECFRILLNNGGDIHSRSDDGTYIFHHVARSEKLSNEFMQILIDREVSIHALGASGWNAIHFAAARGSTVCISMLYNLGLDINAKTNDDLTAYHIALSRGELAAAKLLQTLSARTSSNSPDQIEMRRPSPGQANMEVDEPPSKRQSRPNRCLQCKCKACVKKENQLTNQQCEIAELKHEVATTKERVRGLEVERDVSGNGSSFFSATMTDLSSGDMLSKDYMRPDAKRICTSDNRNTFCELLQPMPVIEHMWTKLVIGQRAYEDAQAIPTDVRKADFIWLLMKQKEIHLLCVREALVTTGQNHLLHLLH